MSEIYETDILIWSQEQAALLRRVAAGERVNTVDWDNVIEEIESVGSEQVFRVQALLMRALLHMLKAEAWPLARDAEHWRGEAVRFRIDATRRFAPSMRQRIDVPKLYQQALRAMPRTNDGQPPLPVPAVCPVTLDELLSDD